MNFKLIIIILKKISQIYINMDQLKKLTKVQITTLCKEHGVPSTSKQKKDELLENLLGKMSIDDLDISQFVSEKKSKKAKSSDDAEDKPKRTVIVKPKMSKQLKDKFDADLYDKELKQFKLKYADLDLD